LGYDWVVIGSKKIKKQRIFGNNGFPLGWKNTLRLKLRHIVSLSQQETKGRETTLELGIANLIGVAVQFAIELGFLLL
jgi:hypothetical protein